MFRGQKVRYIHCALHVIVKWHGVLVKGSKFGDSLG